MAGDKRVWTPKQRRDQAKRFAEYKKNPYFEAMRKACIRESPFRRKAGERLNAMRSNPEIEKKRTTNSGKSRMGKAKNGWLIPEEHRKFYFKLLATFPREEAQAIVDSLKKEKPR